MVDVQSKASKHGYKGRYRENEDLLGHMMALQLGV